MPQSKLLTTMVGPENLLCGDNQSLPTKRWLADLRGYAATERVGVAGLLRGNDSGGGRSAALFKDGQGAKPP